MRSFLNQILVDSLVKEAMTKMAVPRMRIGTGQVVGLNGALSRSNRAKRIEDYQDEDGRWQRREYLRNGGSMSYDVNDEYKDGKYIGKDYTQQAMDYMAQRKNRIAARKAQYAKAQKTQLDRQAWEKQKENAINSRNEFFRDPQEGDPNQEDPALTRARQQVQQEQAAQGYKPVYDPATEAQTQQQPQGQLTLGATPNFTPDRSSTPAQAPAPTQAQPAQQAQAPAQATQQAAAPSEYYPQNQITMGNYNPYAFASEPTQQNAWNGRNTSPIPPEMQGQLNQLFGSPDALSRKTFTPAPRMVAPARQEPQSWFSRQINKILNWF